MHHPEDFLFVHVKINIASLRCPYAGLVSKFFNGVFDRAGTL